MRILLLLLAMAAAVAAQTYYLDSNAAAGGNGSMSRPFDSLDDILPELDGRRQTVLLKRGSVFEDVGIFVSNNTRVAAYGSGAKPVITFTGNVIGTTGITTFGGKNITIEDIVVERAGTGFLNLGFTENVVYRRCEARQVDGGFAHEDASTARGTVTYIDCSVTQALGDGFINRGDAKDVAIRCAARFCGPLWEDTTPPAFPAMTRGVYVDGAVGSDANDGLSQGRPKATLAGVEAVLQPGDTLFIHRSTTLAGTLDLLEGMSIDVYGGGARPILTFGGSGGDAVKIDGVGNIAIRGVEIRDSEDGLKLTGTCPNVTLIDVLIADNSDNGIEALTGEGTLTLYDVRLENNGGDGAQIGGRRVISFTDVDARGHDASGGNGIALSTDASGTIDRSEFVGNSTGIGVYSNTGTVTVQRSFVDSNISTNTNTIAGILQDPATPGTPTPKLNVYNTVITVPDPGPSDNILGIASEDEFIDVFNCTFYSDNRGTNARNTYLLDVEGADSAQLINNVFEHTTTTPFSGSYFVRGKASFADIAALNNFYHDTGGAPSRWHNGSSAQTFAQWGAPGLITDEVTGAYETGGFLRGSPIGSLWNAIVSGASGATPENGGTNIVAGVFTTDYGGIPRGRDTTFAAGAFECNVTSPDGFTTHDTSTWRLIECSASFCLDGGHFTHTGSHGDAMAVVDCVFEGCMETGITGAAAQDFTIDGCKFLENVVGLNQLSPSTGVTQNVTRCIFWDNGTSLQSNPATSNGILSVQNSVFVLPESSNATEVYGIRVFPSASPLFLFAFNNTFILPKLASEDATYFGVYDPSAIIVLNNNVFLGANDPDLYYVRFSTNTNVEESDYNFFLDTGSEDDKFRNDTGPTDLDFAGWQALNRGLSGGSATTDGNGFFSASNTIDVLGHDARLQEHERYVAKKGTDGWGAGFNRFGAFREDLFGAVRGGDTDTWNIGPGVYSEGSEGVFRSPGRLLFVNLDLTGFLYRDIRIADRCILGSERERVVIDEIRLVYSDSAGTMVTLHEDRLSFDRPLHSTFLGQREIEAGPLLGGVGEDLYLSFSATSGAVYGEVLWHIESTSTPRTAVAVSRARGMR